MHDLREFIEEQMLILVPVLYVFGMLLKNTPRVPDWTIPWALLVVGTALAVLLLEDPLHGVIQGVLVTGATVLAHQLVKQTLKKK